MNRKKTALALLSAFIAILTACVVTGAIQFSPMPSIFMEYFEGSIENTTYALAGWDINIEGADALSVWLNGTCMVSGDYFFNVTILDNSGYEVVSATRTISLTSGIYSNEQFYCTAPNIVSRFTYIDVKISR